MYSFGNSVAVSVETFDSVGANRSSFYDAFDTEWLVVADEVWFFVCASGFDVSSVGSSFADGGILAIAETAFVVLSSGDVFDCWLPRVVPAIVADDQEYAFVSDEDELTSVVVVECFVGIEKDAVVVCANGFSLFGTSFALFVFAFDA